METLEIGKQLVDLCKNGQNQKAIESLYAKDIVSLEAVGSESMPAEARGLDAIKKKNQEFVDTMEIHDIEVHGPFPHGDQFAVMFKYDATEKKSGKRMDMEEVALYTVKNDKIVKEEFFYMM